jgi:hypothetical protein
MCNNGNEENEGGEEIMKGVKPQVVTYRARTQGFPPSVFPRRVHGPRSRSRGILSLLTVVYRVQRKEIEVE